MRADAYSEGKRWLDQAREDLRWADHRSQQGAFHLACFLSQQVAEKAIKAFLYGRGEEVVLGHSVERLCAAAARYEPAFEERSKTWSLLDGYYIPTRYPNGLPEGIPAHVYTRDAAEGAVELARQTVDHVTHILRMR